MAETRGQTAMNTLSSDEMIWIEKQVTQSTAWGHSTERPRLLLAEMGTHTGELAGTKNAVKLEGTDSQVIDPTRRRLLAKFWNKRDQDTFGSV